MKTENDKNAYSEAFKMALKVEFLANREELFLYAGALYSAIMWGRGIDENNKRILKEDASVK